MHFTPHTSPLIPHPLNYKEDPMNRYFTNETSLSALFKRSLRLHYLTLKHSIFCILMLTLIKYLSVIFHTFFNNSYALWIITIVSVLIASYFFAAALLATHRSFNDHPQSIWNAMRTIKQQSVRIYTTFFTYIAGIVAVYYLCELFMMGIAHFVRPSSALHAGAFLFMLTFVLVFIATFYFSFPLSIIDEKPLKKAFFNSAVLTEKNKVGVLSQFFIIACVFVLMTPGAIHEYFLSVYYLDALFDFVVLCIAVPLYINLLLFIIQDSKLQLEADILK